MSEARESYYEIALTNRQVMSIFVVLLICLLSAFVSGLWIGRQGGGGRVQTADAQAIEAGTAAGEAPLGDMDFFSGPEQESGGASAGSTPPEERVNEAVRQEREVDREEEPAPREKPKAKTEKSEKPAQFGELIGPEEISNEEEGEFLFIQVFSSMDEKQAESVVERLRKDGLAAFLSSSDVEGRLMHRVRIGPYAERSEAERVAKSVQKKHKLSTWITR